MGQRPDREGGRGRAELDLSKLELAVLTGSETAEYATVHPFAAPAAVPLSVAGQPLPPVPVADLLP